GGALAGLASGTQRASYAFDPATQPYQPEPGAVFPRVARSDARSGVDDLGPYAVRLAFHHDPLSLAAGMAEGVAQPFLDEAAEADLHIGRAVGRNVRQRHLHPGLRLDLVTMHGFADAGRNIPIVDVRLQQSGRYTANVALRLVQCRTDGVDMTARLRIPDLVESQPGQADQLGRAVVQFRAYDLQEPLVLLDRVAGAAFDPGAQILAL